MQQIKDLEARLDQLVSRFFRLTQYYITSHAVILAIPIAIIGGAVFGAAGLGSRSKASALVRVVSIAVMSGMLAGEGLLWLVRRGNAGDFVFALEMIVGLMLPWLLLRDRSEQVRAWWGAVAIGVAVLAFEAVIRTVMSL
jgi:sulfite exporter TauE/SafE